MRSLISLLRLCWPVFPSAGRKPPVPFFVGAGFSNPFPLPVAPGQLLTLFVQPPGVLSPRDVLQASPRSFWNGSDRSHARFPSQPGQHRLQCFSELAMPRTCWR